MALIAHQTIDQDGLNPPTVAACTSGGDTTQPAEGMFLEFVNADAAPHDVKIDDPRSRTPEGATGFDPDVTLVVAAGSRARVAVPGKRYQNPSDGLIHIAYPGGDVTALSVGAFVLDET